MTAPHATVSSPPRFTDKQGQYLAFICTYELLNGRAPAEADLQRFFGVTPPTVHQMIVTLTEAGLIRRTPGVARSIELLVDPEDLPALRRSPNQPIKTSVARY
jgi:DNA-binding MarR family transcriptional regulator